jgi:hypothetical protein
MKVYGQQPPIPLLDSKTSIRGHTSAEIGTILSPHRISITSMMDTYRETRAISAEQHDKGRTKSDIKVGSLVAVPSTLSNVAVTKFDDHKSHKSRAIYVGPFKVLVAEQGDNFRIDMNNGNRSTFHVSQLKHLPPAAGTIEPEFGQPASLLWPNGKPKIRFIDRTRIRRNGPQYLVHFWGQHHDQGTWVAKSDINAADKDLVSAFDARHQSGTPSFPTGQLILDTTRAPTVPFRRTDINTPPS